MDKFDTLKFLQSMKNEWNDSLDDIKRYGYLPSLKSKECRYGFCYYLERKKISRKDEEQIIQLLYVFSGTKRNIDDCWFDFPRPEADLQYIIELFEIRISIIQKAIDYLNEPDEEHSILAGIPIYTKIILILTASFAIYSLVTSIRMAFT